MGNRMSRKCSISREKSYGQNINVITSFDPASLQRGRNITGDSEKLSDEVPVINKCLPSPCPAFNRVNEKTGSDHLKNSSENFGYLTVRQFEDLQQQSKESHHFVPKIDDIQSEIASTDMEEGTIVTDDHREIEKDERVFINEDIEYDSIPPRTYEHEDGQHHSISMDNPEYFNRGGYARMSQQTNSSKDSAITADTYSSGRSCSKDYMCLNCVCRKQHNNIEYMVDVYKKRLQRDLRVEDILKDLHCIDDLQKEEIEKKSKESRQEAVYLLLGYIRHSDEPGKWQNFIEALEIAGNTAIVKLLKNETENDSEKSRKILSLMSRQLVFSISVDEFLDLLFEEELLTEMDKDIIESEKKNNGQLAAAHKMFNMIPSRSHVWEQRLPGILKKCGLGDVAELMHFSEECQEPPDISIGKRGDDETDLKKSKCNHKKNHYEVHHNRNQSNGRFRHEMHYETIHNRTYGTDIAINELRRQVTFIEEKANSHSNALTELSNAQQRNFRELKSNVNDLQNKIKDLRKEESNVEDEHRNQRRLIQNMKLELNDFKNSLNDIKSLILKLAPSPPPEACKATAINVTADSGFSAGLSSIPEDEINYRINYDLGALHDDPEEYQTKL